MKAFLPVYAKPDDTWTLALLKPTERRLYLSMDRRDREHVVRTAKRLLHRYPDVPRYVLRAALLHDAGKARRPYRAMERIITGVLSPRVSSYPLKPGPVGAFQVRAHHADYAASQLEDPLVAEVVRLHHTGGSLWADRLRAVDREF